MPKLREPRLLIEIIAALLILVFVYTAVSKLADFKSFKHQMHAQPFPGWVAAVTVWTLPPIEMIAAVLLVFSRSRLTGLYVSFALMLIFTVYVALALAGAFGDIPCSCGGIIEQLSWESHLAINLVITGLALTGIVVYDKENDALP